MSQLITVKGNKW